MTQSIIIQVGQCGNQIGSRFWDLALHEHAFINPSGSYDEAFKSFFHCTNLKSYKEVIRSETCNKTSGLKARAVAIDMEEGVINEMLRMPVGQLFDTSHKITSVSGSANNWAVGHLQYGRQHENAIVDVVQKQAEKCDSLQCFFLIHSMGGGTGSGLGTAVLALLRDEYPDVYHMCIPVYPSINDDVVTSPYNTVLAMEKLTDFADCVIPLENQALLKISERIETLCNRSKKGTKLTANNTRLSMQKPFDQMNNLAAHLLLHLTSSSRFGGNLNVDLNEVSANLVPYPRMHYLVSALAPLYTLHDAKTQDSKIDQIFSDCLSPTNQLFNAKPNSSSVFLASAILGRGDITISDINRNIDRLQSKIKFIPWNNQGWKIGLCAAPSVGIPRSILSLTNYTAIHHTFTRLKTNFLKLYSRKAHLHHYTSVAGMDDQIFESSLESLTDLIEDYLTTEKQATQSCFFPRLKIPK